MNFQPVVVDIVVVVIEHRWKKNKGRAQVSRAL